MYVCSCVIVMCVINREKRVCAFESIMNSFHDLISSHSSFSPFIIFPLDMCDRLEDSLSIFRQTVILRATTQQMGCVLISGEIGDCVWLWSYNC